MVHGVKRLDRPSGTCACALVADRVMDAGAAGQATVDEAPGEAGAGAENAATSTHTGVRWRIELLTMRAQGAQLDAHILNAAAECDAGGNVGPH